MQTFLPYAEFDRSAHCLDMKRLGKQRLEAKQLLTALRTNSNGWRYHPARIMWIGYTEALAAYYNAIVSEWVRRGYKNSMQIEEVPGKFLLPPWIGYEEFHASHRARLLEKKPEWYQQFNWKEAPSTKYYWPIGKMWEKE